MQRDDILDMLKNSGDKALFSSAATARDHVFGREVFQRGVIEFSNHCQKNCQYCGLRNANENLARFSLDENAMLLAAQTVVDTGMGTVVLQAGEMSQSDLEYVGFVGNVVRRIKAMADVSVTLSLGDYDEDTYRFWRDCGADRYLLKMETFNPALHARLRPGQSVHERLKRVETLCRIGYETGSGIITGLPGMTLEILAEDILQLSRLPLDMIAVGPFIPHPATPLHGVRHGSTDEALRVTAILRLMHPFANIPATSALDALTEDGRERGLRAGANVIMPSVTPEAVRAEYNIYPGKNSSHDPVRQTIGRLQNRLRDAGYNPSSARGISPARTV